MLVAEHADLRTHYARLRTALAELHLLAPPPVIDLRLPAMISRC